VQRAKGHAHNPLGMDELRLKFNDCVGQALPAARRDGLFERLSALQDLGKVSALYT
jgi:hypothetical protein